MTLSDFVSNEHWETEGCPVKCSRFRSCLLSLLSMGRITSCCQRKLPKRPHSMTWNLQSHSWQHYAFAHFWCWMPFMRITWVHRSCEHRQELQSFSDYLQLCKVWKWQPYHARHDDTALATFSGCWLNWIQLQPVEYILSEECSIHRASNCSRCIFVVPTFFSCIFMCLFNVHSK